MVNAGDWLAAFCMRRSQACWHFGCIMNETLAACALSTARWWKRWKMRCGINGGGCVYMGIRIKIRIRRCLL